MKIVNQQAPFGFAIPLGSRWDPLGASGTSWFTRGPGFSLAIQWNPDITLLKGPARESVIGGKALYAGIEFRL